MAKTNTNPEIRFGGFKEDWEEKDFEQVFSNISNNSLSREKLNYVNGMAKNVHYGDILVKFNEVLDVEKDVLPYISDNVTVEKLKNSFLKDGDIIISDAAEDEIVGKCVELLNVNNEIILSGLHTIAVRPKQKFAPRYLGYYMNSNSYHDQLMKLMQGTKVLSISKSAIKNTVIRNPKSEDEQLKIGNYLESIDKLIAQHQQKYDKFKIIRKAMMEKMFPKDGTDLPEIRFKGFEGNWEKKELGKICDIVKGVQINIVKLTQSGKYPVINGGISASGFTDNWNALENTISISEGGNSCGFVNFLHTKFWSGGHCYTLNKLSNNVYAPFLFQELKFKQTEIMELRVGSGLPNIQKGAINNFYIHLPSPTEQEKIGNYFENLDYLISNQETQVAKLQNIKRAFLAKMFI